MSESGPPPPRGPRAQVRPPDVSGLRRQILLAVRAAVDAELQALAAPAGEAVPSGAPPAEPDLRGLTQLDAVRLLALQSGGTLLSREAVRLFREAGLTRGTPSAVVYALLRHNAREFDREAAGRYRLASPAATAARLLRPKGAAF